MDKHKSTVPAPTETLVLSFPINVDGMQTDKLTVRRPKVRDRVANELYMKTHQDDTPHQSECNYLANLCDIDPSALNDMDYADFTALQKVVGDMQVFTMPKK